MNESGICVADEGDRAKVLFTVMLAFATDPMMRWLFPSADAYMASQSVVSAICGQAFGRGSVFFTHGYTAAALWLPAGVGPDEARLAAALEALVPADRFDTALRIFEAMEAHHPHEPYWDLPLLAVDPAHQGQGLGAALMERSLRRIDEDAAVAYLVSSNPRNIPLYERFGFDVIGEIQFGTAPAIHPMRRDAAHRRARLTPG